MTEVGGVFKTDVALVSNSFIDIFAPTGEQIKITTVYAKDANGNPKNGQCFIAPVTGSETDPSDGTGSADSEIPPIGGNPSYGSSNVNGLQPVFMTDSQGLHVGNGSDTTAIQIEVLGVRVA